jgi:hypothetical protein
MYEDVENKINEMKTKIPRERCNKPQDSKAWDLIWDVYGDEDSCQALLGCDTV